MGIVRGKHHLEHALRSDHRTTLMSSVSRLSTRGTGEECWPGRWDDDEKAKSGYSEAQLVPQTSWGDEWYQADERCSLAYRWGGPDWGFTTPQSLSPGSLFGLDNFQSHDQQQQPLLCPTTVFHTPCEVCLRGQQWMCMLVFACDGKCGA